jgi:hypothetical protein
MAADDAAVVVTLRANLKDYEAALKSAVRSTETAARAAEKAVSGIGKGGGASKVIEGNFKKSSQAIANDAKILQFQLNDIFSGLASGQGIRAVQVQLGQIAQQMTGSSLIGGARLLGSAFVGMINPINLAVVAFGLLAGVAASYFSGSEEQAKKATEELKKQAKELDDLAKAYGTIFPELVKLANAQKAAADAAEKNLAMQTALAGTYKNTSDTVEKLLPQFVDLIATLSDISEPTEAMSNLQKQFNNLSTAVDEHKASAKDVQAVIDALNKIIAEQQGQVKDLATRLRDDLVQAYGEVERAAKSAGEAMQGGNVPGPGAGGWTVTPDRLKFSLLGGSPMDAALGRAADAIDAFTERVIQAESSGNLEAKNPLSSATGAGQFIDSTWLEVFKRNFATEAAGMSDAAILAMRTDIETNRRMIRAYATENAKLLIDAGQEVNEAALQLAHFLGAGGAIAVLKAAPGTKISQILSAKQIAANQSILGGGATREDVLAYAARRAGTTAAVKEQKKSYDELVASINAKTDAQKRENEISSDTSKSVDEKTAAMQREKQAQEAARVELELNNAATKDGIPLTDELKAKNHELAEAYAAAGLAADQLNVLQKKSAEVLEQQRQAAEQLKQQFAGVLSSALTGFAHDLENGKDAGEAFADMLKNVASQLIDMAIQMMIVKPLMNSLFGGAGGFSGGGAGLFEAGGTVGLSGRHDGRKFSPALWAGAPRFGAGGMVGLRPGEMPIIAHRGEIIIPNARRMAGAGAAGGAGRQTVDVRVSAAPSPLLDLSIKTSAKQAEERAVSRGPAVARDNNRRFASP